jgi:hypothetical protein
LFAKFCEACFYKILRTKKLLALRVSLCLLLQVTHQGIIRRRRVIPFLPKLLSEYHLDEKNWAQRRAFLGLLQVPTQGITTEWNEGVIPLSPSFVSIKFPL